MPRHQETVAVDKDEWVELTANDVTVISFQVLDGAVEIRRANTNQPEFSDRGWIYAGGTGEREINLTSISAGTGARLWAKGRRSAGSEVMVDHA